MDIQLICNQRVVTSNKLGGINPMVLSYPWYEYIQGMNPMGLSDPWANFLGMISFQI